MNLRSLFAAATLLCLPVVHAAEAQWLKDARARESLLPGVQDVKSKDGWFKARVPAKVSGDIVKEEGSYTITFDIAAEAPIYCEVVPEGFDFGDMLRRALDLTLQEAAEVQGKVEVRQLEHIDAGHYGGVPWLSTRWIYRVNDGKEARLGGLKQLVLARHGHGVYCAHVDLGYVETFRKVTRAFAESFEAAPVDTAPYYQEIATASVGGKKMGIAITRLVRDGDGDTRATQTSAMLMATPDGTFHTFDTAYVEWTHPDASLINAMHVVVNDGNVVTDATLQRREGQWFIDGEAQGKKLEAKLATDAQPGTWIGQAYALRKLMEAETPIGSEYRVAVWMADEPGKLTEAMNRVTAKKGAEAFSITGSSGNMLFTATLEKRTGSAIDADIQMSDMKMRLDRVYVNGSF